MSYPRQSVDFSLQWNGGRILVMPLSRVRPQDRHITGHTAAHDPGGLKRLFSGVYLLCHETYKQA